ncbi:DUF4114 domain-containing protein [Roseibium sp.]|uniref:DUF4114 domain-containing protein n=1 Tax=Roseibium sp. TaxID=1936156 RepID=UPI003B5025F3
MASLPATRPMIGTDEDDTLVGTRHSDVMSGRFGDDVMSGNNGNDEVWGGTGDDILYGNNGNDILYGSGGPDLVEVTGIEIVDDHPVSVVFEGETAGYRNTFGDYKIQEDGLITDVEILWPNASLQGSGGNLIQGESREYLDVQAGDTLGFFIISNGYSLNGGYQGLDLDVRQDGENAPQLMFKDADGNQATIHSDGPRLYHIAADGTETMIRTNPYHTAAFGETVDLNPDGILHTTGVLKADAGTITLGFEDLYNGGDRDFDDSVFTVDIGVQNALVLNAHYQQDDSGTDPDPSHEGVGSQVVEIERSDNDILVGGDGSDELHGRSGNDDLSGNNGHDDLHGGSGDDNLKGNSGEDDLYGNSGNDTLNGGNHNDKLNGNNGNDALYGEAGNDEMIGGTGDDMLDGGNGDDSLIGGSGVDNLSGGYGNDELKGGAGDDTLDGGNDDDVLVGGSGADTMIGGYGNDDLKGGADNDTMDGGHGDDSLIGGSGDDIMTGGAGADVLKGGSGNDELSGGSHNDELYGGHGDDTFYGDAGNDMMHGGRGNDTVDYSAFDVDLSISLHNKKAHGLEIGTDTIKFIDNIVSGGGDDILKGSRDANVIEAGAGDDTIRSLQGADTLTGGEGSDTFVYRSYDLSGGTDTITDFLIGTDKIDLSQMLHSLISYVTEAVNGEDGEGSGGSSEPGTTTIDYSAALARLDVDVAGEDLTLLIDRQGNDAYQEVCTLVGVGNQTVSALHDNDCFIL